MRHQPDGIDAVAMKSAANLVVDAAARHLLQGEGDGVQGVLAAAADVIAQQKFQVHGLGELGRTPEPAVLLVIIAEDALRRRRQQISIEGAGVAADIQHPPIQRFRQRLGGTLHLIAPFAIGIRHPHQHLPERRHIKARLAREIGPAIKRATIRHQKNRHRPAPVPAEGLHRLHVDVVHVRALFPVHLDVYKQFVHQAGGGVVLKALVRHHMTPVAGAVPHAEQDGLVFLAGLLKGFLAPGVPVHRIFLVLEQVGTRLMLQTVHEHLPNEFL